MEHLRLSNTTPEVCRFGMVSRLPNTLPAITVAVRFAQSLLPPRLAEAGCSAHEIMSVSGRKT
jgi:hypothetical protein